MIVIKNELNRITIIINSCDKYSDLWIPFFTLFKKYWIPQNERIILNTETTDFSFPGLSIECIHPVNSNDSYGTRMINVLKQVKSPYVIPFLDDFFIRNYVNKTLINSIVKWMDSDKSIVYFNCDVTKVGVEWENNLYPGFHRIPPGNSYTLNMQAAVWRTEALLRYWRPNITPWEWEEYTNLLAARNRRDKFYCAVSADNTFCDYGFNLKGMGVHRGKWVRNDVVPLFKKECIEVDFSQRGFLEDSDNASNFSALRESIKTLPDKSDMIKRCLRKTDQIKYYFFVKRNKALGLFKYSPDNIYIKFQLFKEKKRFIRKHPNLKYK